MHTPSGTLEFKYFFSSHVGTSDGGESSATAIRAMIRTCRFDASRIGIGDLRSCMIYGEGWQVIIRAFESMQVAGFFKSYPHGEALEHEIDVIVREAQVV